VPLDRDGRAVDAKVTTGKKREEPRPSEVEGRGACTVTPNDLAPSRKILHRTTKRIKFHTAVIINSELSNRDKILNKVRGKKNIIKMKIMREVSCAGGGDRIRLPSPTIMLEEELQEGGVEEERVPTSEVTWLVAPVSKYHSC
jgi:hypothetical protein